MIDVLTEVKKHQEIASNPAYNVWVNANAGSGKTKVLVDRVLRLLLSKNVYPENILCITYTKAATIEMKNRINKILSDWSICSDEKLRLYLNDLLGKVPTVYEAKKARRLYARILDSSSGLKILTIHSFCQTLLLKFPVETGINSNFEVIEDTSSLLDEIFYRLCKFKENKKIIQRITTLFNNNTTQLKKIINDIIEKRNRFNIVLEKGFEEISMEISSLLDINDDFDLTKIYFFYNSKLITKYSNDLKNIAIYFNGQKSKKDKDIGKKLLESLENISIDSIINIFYTKKQKVKKTVLKAQETNGILKNIIDLIESFIEKKIRLEIFQNTNILNELAFYSLKTFINLKKEKGVLDFQDLIFYTQKLLDNENIAPWILSKTDYGHTHILIDESQDTSSLLWEIVKKITTPFFDGSSDKDHTIFVVGDDKQSIYSFQGSEPKEFLKAKSYFKEKIVKANNKFKNISLNTSFRSLPLVLNWVDESYLDIKDLKHTTIRNKHKGHIELTPRIPYFKDNYKVHATLIVDKINSMIGKVYVPSRKRMAKAKDFLILVLKRDDLFFEIISRLQKENIPTSGADKMDILKHIVSKDILSFLKFLCLPEDNLNLACLLKSPFINFNDEDLINLRIEKKDDCLWYQLKKQKDKKYINVYNYLNSFLSKSDYQRPYETISEILYSNSPNSLMKAKSNLIRRLGLEIIEFINAIHNEALIFENNHVPNLQNFILYIEKSLKKIKKENDSNLRNEVRIMTVHGAKGLQAPIVFLADCARKSSQNSANNPLQGLVAMDEKKSLYIKNNLNRNIKIAERYINDLKDIEIIKGKEEYLRLMYVAMTRAEDILIAGGFDSNTNKVDLWYDYLKKGIESIYQKLKNDKNYNCEIKKIKNSESIPLKIFKNLNDGMSIKNISSDNTKSDNKLKVKEIFSLPKWVNEKVKKEEPVSRKISPSNFGNIKKQIFKIKSTNVKKDHTSEINAVNKGNAIHQVLQNIRSLQDLENVIFNILKLTKFNLSKKEQISLSKIIKNNLKKYIELFIRDTYCEVPIAGKVEIDGKEEYFSGKIDRLTFIGDVIWLIDYKTGKKDIKKYLSQMTIYYKMVKEIYPNNEIKVAILWTEDFDLEILKK